VDSVHGDVDRIDPVHHGPAAIAVCLSSLKLGLRPLRWPKLPDEGRRRERGARGPSFRLTGARKVAAGRASFRVAQGSEMGQKGAGEEGRPRCPFIGLEGERGSRVAVVVRHKGGGGGPFGRGSTGVVVSDEGGGWSGRYGSRRGVGRRHVNAHEVTAAAVGPGRKTTEWGLCVSERGRRAGWAGQAES
jgi:hypothetical protein